jgi:hypothetical protein
MGNKMIYAQIAQGKQIINLQDNKKYESKIFFFIIQ